MMHGEKNSSNDDSALTGDCAQKEHFQSELVKEQGEFCEFTSKLAHDIVSPLINLESVINDCRDLPENQLVKLRNAINNIKNIAGALLHRYKQYVNDVCLRQEQDICVPLILSDIVDSKMYEYKDKHVSIRYIHDHNFNYSFVKNDQYNFCKMISNLIDILLMEDCNRPNVVEITTNVTCGSVNIIISCNNIPNSIVEKILHSKNSKAVDVKEYEALFQIRNTLNACGADLRIDSESCDVEKMIITFRECATPVWVIEQIVVHKDSVVLVLDDDESMYDLWRDKFSVYSNIILKFFKHSMDVVNFVEKYDPYNREKLFILADYDLREDSSGLHCVLECGLRRQSVITTSAHNDKIMNDLIIASDMKMLPKRFLNDVSVVLVD